LGLPATVQHLYYMFRLNRFCRVVTNDERSKSGEGMEQSQVWTIDLWVKIILSCYQPSGNLARGS